MSKRHLILLSAWIASLTVGLDVVNELKLFDLMALVGLLVFGGVMSRRQARTDRLLRWTVVFFGAAVFATLVTVLRGISPLRFLVILLRLYRLFGYVALFWIIRYLGLNRRQLVLLLHVLLWSAFVQAVLIVLQHFEILPLLWPEKELFYGPQCGPSGTLGVHHLNVVLYMSVAVSCIMALWRGAGRRIHLLQPWLVAAIPVMAAAAIYGRARSALLAVAALAISAVRQVQGVLLVALALLLMAIVSARTGLESDQAYQKMVQENVLDKWDGEDGSVDNLYGLDVGRPLIWKRTLEALARRIDVFLIGTGFQNYSNLDRRSVSAHCLYLHVLVELGIGGLIVFLAWIRCLWRSLRAMERIPQPAPSAVGHAGTMCLLTLLILGVFNESFYPARALPGAMGFCLAFFAVACHRGWLLPVPDAGRRSWPAMDASGGRPLGWSVDTTGRGVSR